ncbi:protein of unknown function [Belliella buryatensis]|uniref:DUF3784 domain-containing protein n=1 Tax=Belliella buryatensis TaxID=1500549 RepID=A0A239C8Z3_9BACT|nr:DUF3784 domain-containing protein [Belliella buryatensis]SNS16705.1 protein of unknown function [Belliella buryatensis]
MEGVYIALLFLGLGALVRKFPNLLAGYGSLSQREKEKAVKNGAPVYISWMFILMGVLTILGHLAGVLLDMPNLGQGVGLLVTMFGAVLIIILGNRLIHKD